jgi:hypothetical protein
VRQRNTTGSAWTFMGDPPVQVEVGEITDHEVLLDGWTAVEDEPEKTPAADEPPKTTRKRAAAADTDTEGGEPR